MSKLADIIRTVRHKLWAWFWRAEYRAWLEIEGIGEDDLLEQELCLIGE